MLIKNKQLYRRIFQLFKTSFTEFFRDKSFIHGGSLAYFTLVALVPTIYLAYTTVGKVLGQEKLILIIAEGAKDYVGIQDINWLIDLLEKLNVGKGSLTLELFGYIILAFSASAIFNSMRASLNTFFGIRVWEIKLSFWDQIKARLVSFFILTLVGFLFIFFYFIGTVFVAVGSRLIGGESSTWLDLLFSNLTSILNNSIIFFFVFKFLHDGIVHWKIAMRGALFTGVLLYLGQWLIKYYLFNYFFAAGGGVAGTIFLLMVWVFYSAQIIFLGAKVTKVYAEMLNMPILPKKTKSHG